MVRGRTVTVAAALGAGSAGTAAYRLLIEQSKIARRLIGKSESLPPRADGVYSPSGGPPTHATGGELTLVVLGDSTAAGLGCETPEQLPGVLLARGLAEETERDVAFTGYGVVGANSQALDGQIDVALREADGHAPDAAVIIIGANDVSAKFSPALAAGLLGESVARLRELGSVVIVATCPDLGAIRPIPQPLRSVARTWSLRLAKAQRGAVLAAGGHPVAVADLLSPEFLTRPDALFSTDRFHPSAAGYEAAADLLLPALCFELGVWGGGPLPEPPRRSQTAEAARPTARLTAVLNHRLQQRARAGGAAAARVLRIGAGRRRPVTWREPPTNKGVP